MKPLRLLVVLLALHTTVFAQLTIEIISVPANTPAGDIYLAGNFNTWNPGDINYRFEKTGSKYVLSFTPAAGLLEFKFTRGSWATVEGTAGGNYLPNRSYTYNGSPGTLQLSIAGWEGLANNSTASANVSVLSNSFYMPQLNRNRRIWLYLPKDYYTSNKYYPVLYMHDGQNLFDNASSFSGEWRVDETLNQLFDQGDYGAIVVGIDNGGAERLNEMSPWVNTQYGGGKGRDYTLFIVNTLKPYIDSLYRTRTDAPNTAIIGSSMGGLISTYAAMEFPFVFGKAGIFSPAFWFARDSCLSHIAYSGRRNTQQYYFVAGTNESSTMVPYMQQVHQALQNQGYNNSSELRLLPHTDGQHAEWYWAREFGAAYKWLFPDVIQQPCRSFNFPSGISGTGYTYQWQLNDGTGFVNISNNSIFNGVKQDTLRLINAPGAWYGYHLRCIASKNNLSDTGQLHTLRFSSTWTGAAGTAWENGSNWSCGTVPDAYTDVLIINTANKPVLNSNAACRSVRLEPGATLTVMNNFILQLSGEPTD
ncbi:MAG TPA: alpha/beta hydrolase-fold protein [Ferruginibacter sp.]|nr:alpha/beta hydrolase-fold protein [Ferruginibacter sp.]HMP21595.1 alpha/beta hydrolase-fold protein [Ferruginibacter sp.]